MTLGCKDKGIRKSEIVARTQLLSNIYLCLRLGLGALTVERSFFAENERNDQERSHRSEKKRTLRTRS